MVAASPYTDCGYELVFPLFEFRSPGHKFLDDARPIGGFQFTCHFGRHYIDRGRAGGVRVLLFRFCLRRRARALQNLFKSSRRWFETESKYSKFPARQLPGQSSRQPRLRILAFIGQNDQSTFCRDFSLGPEKRQCAGAILKIEPKCGTRKSLAKTPFTEPGRHNSPQCSGRRLARHRRWLFILG